MADVVLWLVAVGIALSRPGVGVGLALLIGAYEFPSRAQPMFSGAPILVLASIIGMGLAATRREKQTADRATKTFDLGLLPAWALTAVIAFGGWGVMSSDAVQARYARDKLLLVLLASLPLCLMARAVARDGTVRRDFLATLVVIATGLSTLALVTGSGEGSRAAALGGGPIVLAWMCSFALFVLLYAEEPDWQGGPPLAAAVGLRGAPLRASRVVVMLLLLQTILRTDSRGPLLVLVLTVAVVFLDRRRRQQHLVDGAKRRQRRLVVVLTLGFLVVMGFHQLHNPNSRVSLLLNPGKEVERSRGVYWDHGVELVKHPVLLGRGFGGFLEGAPASVIYDGAHYPHNLVMECLIEAGPIAGLGAIVVLLWALGAIMRARDRLGFALAFYAFGVAQLSGDLYNSRYVFFFCAFGLATAVGSRSSDESLGPQAPASAVSVHS